MNGTLFLIPTTIGDTPIDDVIPQKVKDTINEIKYFIVENERTARRQLIKMGIKTAIDDLKFYVLNKHTDRDTIDTFLTPCMDGNNIGLLSEAGVPAVADPGSDIVAIAHIKQIKVIPLVGPSSILLALMASGLNGQGFSFNGYLPVKTPERVKKIKQLESISASTGHTQIFIEAPYRNNQMLKDLISSCSPTTRICVASLVTTDSEYIKTMSAQNWKKNKVDLHKKPTLFLLLK